MTIENIQCFQYHILRKLSLAISKAKNSAVCNLLIYFEFVLHIVYEN